MLQYCIILQNYQNPFFYKNYTIDVSCLALCYKYEYIGVDEEGAPKFIYERKEYNK